MLSYEGIFFDGDTLELIRSLEKVKLPIISDVLHCTFKYRPTNEQIFNDIVGQSFDLYLIGYGNDGMNSGFKVELPEELKPYYINYDEEITDKLKTPHITTSLAEGAIAMKTKNLDFQPLEKPIKISGKFGYWIKDENGGHVSYKPYKK